MKDSQQESHTESRTSVTVKAVDYFYNEQGDFTITLHGEPIAMTKDRGSAQRLKNSYATMALRIDTLSKVVETYYKKLQKIKAQTFDIR